MVETEGCNSNYAESESVQGTEDSVFIHQENREKRLESMKKVRSIRLHRFSSMRSSTRIGKPQNENRYNLSSIGTENPQGPTPIETSDTSPHYMKGTSSSHAKESFQNTQRLFTKKTFTRMSTMKLKRSLTRKLSGRTEQKRKLKSSRSIKLGSFKGTKSTRKGPEFIRGNGEQDWTGTSDNRQTYSTKDGNKPQRAITRRLSFKPVRILKKMPTFKSKNSSMEKCHDMSRSLESSLHRATCSSTLKDSHFPGRIELSQEGSGAQVVSTMKVCPYSYCSLHGHHRNELPTLKRFVSMRRRQLKAQKSMKMDGRPVARSKQSGNNARKKLAKESSVRPQDTKGCTFAEGGIASGEDERYKLGYDTEVLIRETSYPGVINFEESTSMDVVKSCASDIGILEGEVATKGINMEGLGDNEVMQMSYVQKEAEPACATNAQYIMQERDDKYMKMWHLVYKHAVLANTGREENMLLFDGNDKEGEGKEAQSFDGVNSSSSQDHCETDHDVDVENKSLIDLVQKAFDEILLPEPVILSSDDDLKSRSVGSDEELLEKSENNRGEGNISASRESPQEGTQPIEDNYLRSHAEEMTGQRMGSKPDPKTPKSWSNLKKLMVLRRFVKALEKVRKLNFRQPRHLPLDADFEAEKVSLKHQSTEEKRSAEEWMLDYALQKVISKLAPAQRQRVALLVEAFETIRPFQDAQNGSLSSTTMETQANPIQPPCDSSFHGKEEMNKDNASNNPMPELHNDVVFKERCLDYPGTNTVENMAAPGAVEEELNSKQILCSSYDDGEKALNGNDNIHLAEIKDSGSRSLSKPVKNMSSCHEEAPTKGIVDEVTEELISNSNSGILTSQSESSGGDFETKNKIGANSLILKGLARSLGTNLIGSGESSGRLDEDDRTATGKEKIEKANPVTSTLEEIPANEQSKAPGSSNVEPETQPDKQHYMGLWYLVYKHMVSDSAGNDSKSPSNEADEKVSKYESSSVSGTSVPNESTDATNRDMEFKDHIVADPEVELQQIEAIKMVEEAIDSIIPDVQDDNPDIQLLTDNPISDNIKQSSKTERLDSEGLNQKEERIASGNGTNQQQKQEGTASKEGNKPNQQLPKSWSNLKKVIMLRRFIKALEKVRKFNPRGPRYLPIEPDPEGEKVNLRHQDMAERKGTEEWMLDYALRQVVSKLTPARKRKVELLVEAFETVMPTMRN